jgi:hypothetical protein
MKRSAAFLAALASFSCAAPPPAPPVLDRPRAELVERLEEAIQVRFATVTAKDIAKRRLGLGRVADLLTPDVPPHGGRFNAASPDERDLLRRLESEEWLADLYVVHERQDANVPAMVVGPVRLTPAIPLWVDPPTEIESTGHDALAAGATRSGSARGAVLEARVVRTSSALCVKCHDRKSIGDPIAAVVYAFHKAPAKEPASGR